TDTNGMYAFDPVSPGVHDVAVTPPANTTCDPPAQTVDVPADGQAQADFSCSSQPGDLTVTVTVDGAPFGGATVIVSSGKGARTGTTNTAGMVTFTGLEPDDYTVTASVGGATCDTVTASVPAGGSAQAQVTCTS
ncbi:MAG: carboxypeptidase-like regulatory domain-containing protein, partial [Gemmatimonadota bacterium]